MSWLRDQLGRFSRSRSPAASQEAVAPELSPMAQSAIEWLVNQPNAAQKLRGLAPEPRLVTKRAPEPEPEGTLLQLLTANVAAVTESPERLVRPDDELEALAREGYTDEGLREIVHAKSAYGFATLRQAEQMLAGIRTPPELAAGSGRSWRSLDRMAEREDRRAYEALLAGDDEKWLQYTIPGYDPRGAW
jgi:hypothetical protein